MPLQYMVSGMAVAGHAPLARPDRRRRVQPGRPGRRPVREGREDRGRHRALGQRVPRGHRAPRRAERGGRRGLIPFHGGCCTGRSNRIGRWTSRSPSRNATWSGSAATSRRRRSRRVRRSRGRRRGARPTCSARWARSGLLGMLIPEEWGGIGMSTVGFVAAMEQIGLADQSVAAAWQAHVTIGSLPLYLFGNDAQRERWLRPLAEGRALGAFGLTEPDAGSDARGIRTQRRAPRRRLADQRPQDVHLQRRHRHVVRRDAAGPHRVGRRAGADVRELRRREGHARLHDGPEDARHRLARSRHPRAVLRRRVGRRRAPRRRSRRWGSASSCARSRSGASRSPRCRSA